MKVVSMLVLVEDGRYEAAWRCDACGDVTRSEEPIKPPSPCVRCGNIIFIAVKDRMITRDHCGKCGRPVVVSFKVVPEAAWTTVVLNRWRTMCPSCFDVEAHKKKVHYSFKYGRHLLV
jgi:ribosomal protein S27AE